MSPWYKHMQKNTTPLLYTGSNMLVGKKLEANSGGDNCVNVVFSYQSIPSIGLQTPDCAWFFPTCSRRGNVMQAWHEHMQV